MQSDPGHAGWRKAARQKPMHVRWRPAGTTPAAPPPPAPMRLHPCVVFSNRIASHLPGNSIIELSTNAARQACGRDLTNKALSCSAAHRRRTRLTVKPQQLQTDTHGCWPLANQLCMKSTAFWECAQFGMLLRELAHQSAVCCLQPRGPKWLPPAPLPRSTARHR